jgi:Yip1 domain
MTAEPTGGATGIVGRAKNILLQPKAEWERIAGEPADIGKLYIGYVLPLAAVAAIAGFIGATMFGYGAFGVHYRLPLVTGLTMGIVQVVSGVIGVFLLAIIANALAPNFGSQQDQGRAHKLAAYGSTAGFLAGVFAIYPPLAMLGILGLYTLFLLYQGLPVMMKTPDDKRIGYLVTIIIVGIVIGVVLSVVLGMVGRTVGGFPGGPGAAPFGHVSTTQPGNMQGQITLPGGGSVDLSAIEKAGRAAQAGGGSAAIDPASLQRYLPQSLPGGFALTSTSSGGAVGASQAEGVYQNGGARITLTVMDMGAMGAFAAMAGAANVQQNSQNADGYSRTNTVDGRVVTEEVSQSGGSASYAVIGHGVSVSAEGNGGVTVDQVRAAVQAVGVERLEHELGK